MLPFRGVELISKKSILPGLIPTHTGDPCEMNPEEEVKERPLQLQQKPVVAGDWSEFPDIDTTGKFKFKGVRISLTYESHIDKKILEAHVLKCAGESVKKLKFYRSAHEEADQSHPYKHTHVLVHFGQSIQFEAARRFDFVAKLEDGRNVNIHPKMKRIASEEHWTNAKKYLGKEDQENEDLLEKPNVVSGILSCADQVEALRKYAGNDLKAATSVLAVFGCKSETVSQRPLPNPWPWQAWLIDFVKSPPDDRAIWWIYDPKGSGGKSRVGKFLATDGTRDTWLCKKVGNIRDFATNAQTAKRNKWTGKAVIIDLSRQNEEREIYESLEGLKDGFLTAQKYEGGDVVFGDAPHVVVTANHMPKFRNERGKLTVTMNRWRILILRPDGLDFTEASRAKNRLPPSSTPEGPPRIHENATSGLENDLRENTEESKDSPNDLSASRVLPPRRFAEKLVTFRDPFGIFQTPNLEIPDYAALLGEFLTETPAYDGGPIPGAADP